MSPSSPSAPLDENDLLAAEYVLGVLEAVERARAEDLAKKSPAFAARIASSEARLAPIADDIAPVAAPNLMPQIEQRLFGASKRGRFDLPVFAWPKGALGGLLGTGLMAALSVVALALFLQFGGAADQPVVTTTLIAQGSEVQYLARLESGQITLTRIKGAPANAGRSYELWVIDGNAAPVSLGLIDRSLTLPAPAAAPGYVLAITDEPFGGGPGGKATGLVIALGVFKES